MKQYTFFDEVAPMLTEPQLQELRDRRARRSCIQGEHQWMKTETDWGPPFGVRLTWTCAKPGCGEVRGRC
jgi:hypothetical protein